MLNTKVVEQFLEKASRPGLLGLPGQVKEKRFQKELRSYFKGLGAEIKALKLEELVNKEELIARHEVQMRLHNVLRRHSPLLLETLKHHMAGAFELADKMEYLKEADPVKKLKLDRLGQSATNAAYWAEEQAAKLVKDINQTTQDTIADAIAKGIKGQAGVPGTSRLIRAVVDNMEKSRADMIATTEMNRAMSNAALQKMDRLGIEYKQIILAGDACDICESAASQDPLPVDEDYETGDSGPPFHPNCRCAVTGARPPSDEEGD